MQVLPSSPALKARNQALAAKPVNRLTPETARAQVAEHLAEAQQEFWRNPKFARIALRQKWSYFSLLPVLIFFLTAGLSI